MCQPFWPNFSARDPPFQAVSSSRNPLPFVEKENLAFQDQFLQILAKMCSRDPSFKAKISSRDSIFENLDGTNLPKTFIDYLSCLQFLHLWIRQPAEVQQFFCVCKNVYKSVRNYMEVIGNILRYVKK